ncbi:hypothetical protein DFH28DRAFT_880062 [Melampsora americana]|nr:hypothetical protein DFH28DRAFT_880062 [Melampsora americana]
MSWNSSLVLLLQLTCKYTPAQLETLEEVIIRWAGLIDRTKTTWSVLVNMTSIEASGLDDLEMTEQNLLIGEDVGDEHDPLLEPEEIEVDVW